ncbi:MAG: cupredoxin domain-containing protein [Egibacteraceae bacterium]
MRTNQRRVTVAAMALATLAAACSPAGSSAPSPPAGPAVSGDQTVMLADGDNFDPDALRVTSGTTVSWQWEDSSTLHNVTFDDFGSDTQSAGTYTHIFDEAGTFAYVCTLHPNMTGTVVVE